MLCSEGAQQPQVPDLVFSNREPSHLKGNYCVHTHCSHTQDGKFGPKGQMCWWQSCSQLCLLQEKPAKPSAVPAQGNQTWCLGHGSSAGILCGDSSPELKQNQSPRERSYRGAAAAWHTHPLSNVWGEILFRSIFLQFNNKESLCKYQLQRLGKANQIQACNSEQVSVIMKYLPGFWQPWTIQ